MRPAWDHKHHHERAAAPAVSRRSAGGEHDVPKADGSVRSSHIVFAAPSIARFHLHERLRRDLLRRGHRVTVLQWRAAEQTFWWAQGGDVAALAVGRAAATAAPCEELAQRFSLRSGAQRDLAALAPALQQWFATMRPDLVLLHAERDAEHHLAQFAARTAGCRVVWTGDGLLPHTLQISERGLDGDGVSGHRAARDYRVVRGETALLDACLAAVLGGPEPVALPRAEIVVPPLPSRCADALAALLRLDVSGAWHAVAGFREALSSPPVRELRPALPARPFVAVLLQDDADPRVRLDAPPGATAHALLAAAVAAVRAVDPALAVLAVTPAGRRPLELASRAPAGVLVAPAAAAAIAAATAAAVITVNHEAAAVALLAGTPVVHSGRALWQLPGVTFSAAPAQLAAALRDAFAKDHPTLRRRFLSWLFRHGHVWCSPTAPDHNGMLGLVHALERRLPAAEAGTVLRAGPSHRTGPPWPLAAEPPP